MMKNGGTGVNDAINSSTQKATNGCMILTVLLTAPTSDAPIKAIIGAASNRNNINTDSSADSGCNNEIEEEDGVTKLKTSPRRAKEQIEKNKPVQNDVKLPCSG